jgi:hypothetical protein
MEAAANEVSTFFTELIDVQKYVELFTEMESDTLMLSLIVGFTPLITLFISAIFLRTTIPAHEVKFLKDLYKSTNGHNWNRQDGWGRLGFFFCDYVTLYGLTIKKGHVVKITLYKNNLNGALPESIGLMKYLRAFECGANTLTGCLPKSIGDCTHLHKLYLPHNQLSGQSLPHLHS